MSPSAVAAAWAAAIANVLVAIVAAFQDTIRRALHHPKIELEMKPGRPDCQKLTIPGSNGRPPIDVFWFRLRVWNRGSASAHDVEVYASGLEEMKDTKFSPCAWFLPMRLLWS